MHREQRIRKIVAVASIFAFPACTGGARPPDLPEVEELRVEGVSADSTLLPPLELARARATAAALGQELATLVLTTLQSEGPAATVRVCSDIAQERTEAFATDGIYVRRVSERLRNPRNAPDAAEAIELQRLQVLTAEGRLPAEVVRIVRTAEERSLHLLRPIRIQPPCLTCHGQEESIPPDVRQILAERYPDDRAVGYETGDLRGAISVRVPLPMR